MQTRAADKQRGRSLTRAKREQREHSAKLVFKKENGNEPTLTGTQASSTTGEEDHFEEGLGCPLQSFRGKTPKS